MDIFEAIKTRRTIGKVTHDGVPREYIEKILEAGTYAPNHFRTEPWRFFVLEDEARERLGEVFATIGKDAKSSEEKIEKLKKNPLRAPTIITVAVEPSQDDKVIEKEEFAAVSSAVQNMLLAAHGLGLGAIWRTGPLCYEKKVNDFFELSDSGEIVGFIYLGYPNMTPKQPNKTHFNHFTTWMK